MGKAARIMIAKEGRQLLRSSSAALIQYVIIEQPCEGICARRPGDGISHGASKGKIKHRWKLINTRVFGEQRDINIARRDFAENMEVGDALRFGTREHGRRKGSPKFGVYMPRGINAETINAVFVDPIAVDINESLNHARIFSHQIIKPNEIPHR